MRGLLRLNECESRAFSLAQKATHFFRMTFSSLSTRISFSSARSRTRSSLASSPLPLPRSIRACRNHTQNVERVKPRSSTTPSMVRPPSSTNATALALNSAENRQPWESLAGQPRSRRMRLPSPAKWRASFGQSRTSRSDWRAAPPHTTTPTTKGIFEEQALGNCRAFRAAIAFVSAAPVGFADLAAAESNRAVINASVATSLGGSLLTSSARFLVFGFLLGLNCFNSIFELLLREAQAMAKLAHENVVAIYGLGVVEQRVFLAMEFVDGSTLVS